MKKLLVLAAFVVSLGLAIANADQVSFSFTGQDGGGTVSLANGSLDVSGGTSVSGWIDVTQGPLTGHYGTLLLGTNQYTAPFSYDNQVDTSQPHFLSNVNDWGGVAFTDDAGRQINLWFNTTANDIVMHAAGYYSVPDEYGLWGWAGQYSPTAYGSASVPDGGYTLTLLGAGFAAIGLVSLSKKCRIDNPFVLA